MPGPIVHLLVQHLLPDTFRTLEHGFTPNDKSIFTKLLEEDPCSPYTGFGSMGPDFLFFSVKEYGDGLATLVNTIFEV